MRRKYRCITGPDQLEDRKLLSLAAGAAPFPLPLNTHPAVVATATPAPGLLTGGNARVATQTYALTGAEGAFVAIAEKLANWAWNDYLGTPSSQDILDAVNRVSNEVLNLEGVLADWGNRISAQIQGISDKLDANLISDRITDSNTAIKVDIPDFQNNHSDFARLRADENSFAAANRLDLEIRQNGRTSFVGALVYAVNTRIAVLRIIKPNFATDPEVNTEMDGYIKTLQSSLNKINGSINAANTVTVSSSPMVIGGSSSSGGLYIKPRMLGTMYVASYIHNGVVQKSFSALSPLGSSPAQMAAVSQTVRSQAQAAQRKGIDDDRQALEVPSLESVLKAWMEGRMPLSASGNILAKWNDLRATI